MGARGRVIVLSLIACAPEVPAGPPNILLVSIDTFRADRLGSLGNSSGLTPNLDRFAAESVVFTRAYSQSPLTGPSHASMLTSRYPSEVAGTSRAPVIGEDTYTLPQVLGTYGYQTAARVAGGDLNPQIGPTVGFDSYETSGDFGSFWHTIPMATEWLDARDTSRPFFLFVHGYDTHATYLKPTPYGLLHTGVSGFNKAQQATLAQTEKVLDGRRHANFDMLDIVTRGELRPRSEEGREKLAALADRNGYPRVSEPDQELIRKVYDGAVSYADTMFGVFMARLEGRGLLENTTIVVLGDHGEALGEEGLFHRCCSLSDAVTHVPLIVRVPGADPAAVDGLVELVDVMPTILELSGATPPSGVHGRTFGPALRGEPFAGREFAASQGGVGLRMVSLRGPAGRLTYTGVQVTADVVGDVVAAAAVEGPAFESSEGMKSQDRLALRGQMVNWLEDLGESPLAQPAAMSVELKDTLRAKGYWDAE